jgi:hypothetical protein
MTSWKKPPCNKVTACENQEKYAFHVISRRICADFAAVCPEIQDQNF